MFVCVFDSFLSKSVVYSNFVLLSLSLSFFAFQIAVIVLGFSLVIYIMWGLYVLMWN
jgi:hypothetical protein